MFSPNDKDEKHVGIDDKHGDIKVIPDVSIMKYILLSRLQLYTPTLMHGHEIAKILEAIQQIYVCAIVLTP